MDKFMLKIGEFIALKQNDEWSEYTIEKITTVEGRSGYELFIEVKNDYHRITIDLVEYLKNDAVKSLAYD